MNRRLSSSTALALFAGAALFLTIATPTMAQPQNAAHAVTMPPVRVDPVPGYATGNDAVKCSRVFIAGDAVFGASEIPGTSNPVQLLVSSQTAPFNVFRMDDNCNVLSSWSTAVANVQSLTGMEFDSQTGNTIWMVQTAPNPIQVLEFTAGTGVATGRTCPLNEFSTVGPLALNRNSGIPNDFYFGNIATDLIKQVDLTTCTFGCTFSNPDNAGSGAFGNGLDDAVDVSCGADLVVSSGTIGEGQVVRAGQYDCGGTGCPDTWDFLSTVSPAGSVFIQSFIEFVDSQGETLIALNDGIINEFFIIRNVPGVNDCQGQDGEDLFLINLQTGGNDNTINVNANQFFQVNSRKPAAGGNGKFTMNMNAGGPNASTITSLPAQLGNICFPVVDSIPATQMVNMNNIGRTNRLGATNYFGAPQANPTRAPSVVFVNGSGDPTNMPAGSCWTLQGIMFNPGSTSPKGVSVSNAIFVQVE